mmetsp:Transcript_10925/g.28225  ORF Transcript_10925/g.28225 Transcript_10925/m.28225 type:complete len:265 (+) Transcript_10925:1422-2216(+)
MGQHLHQGQLAVHPLLDDVHRRGQDHRRVPVLAERGAGPVVVRHGAVCLLLDRLHHVHVAAGAWHPCVHHIRHHHSQARKLHSQHRLLWRHRHRDTPQLYLEAGRMHRPIHDRLLHGQVGQGSADGRCGQGVHARHRVDLAGARLQRRQGRRARGRAGLADERPLRHPGPQHPAGPPRHDARDLRELTLRARRCVHGRPLGQHVGRRGEHVERPREHCPHRVHAGAAHERHPCALLHPGSDPQARGRARQAACRTCAGCAADAR